MKYMNKCKLRDLVSHKKGYAFSSADYQDDGVMVVRITDFTLESISDSEAVFIEENKKYNDYILETGDILIQTVGSWANNPNSIVGKVVRVPDSCRLSYLNQNIVKIIPNEKINNDYLFYNLKANRFSEYCVIRGQGAANQASITLNTIMKFKMNIHSLVEQKRISDILIKYDQLIENNNKRIKLLEQTAQEIYKEWFLRFRFPGYKNVKFVNGFPNEWSISKIKFCVKRLKFGITYKAEELLPEGKTIVVDQSTSDFIGYHNDAPAHFASFDSPILLFGDHSCKYKLMCENFSLGENIIPYISNLENVSNYYLYYATKDILKTEEYKRHWGRFVNLKILIPSTYLIGMFDDIIIPIVKEQEKLKKINTNLIKQRDLLLPRLMSGKLEVK